MLSTSMTMPSPWHVRSFASVKLSLTRIAQRPSREGNVTAVEGATLAPGDGVVPAGLVVAGRARGKNRPGRRPPRPERTRRGRGGSAPRLVALSQGYTAAARPGFPQTRTMREEAVRIDDRL